MLQSLWECNRRNVGPPRILFPDSFSFFQDCRRGCRRLSYSLSPNPFHFLTLRKLPTSLIRLPLRLPGDGFLSTPSRRVLHAFHPVSQVCLSGLLHVDFCALLCSAACSSTGRRAAIFRHSRRQSCPRFPT